MSTGPGGTSCLRQRKLLATSDVDVGGRGMAAKVALASASSTGAVRWSSPWFETAVVVGAAADGSALGDGGGFLGTGGGTGGRRGRGRTGGDLSGAGSSKADGSRGNAGRKQLAQAVAVAVAGVAAAAEAGKSTPGFKHDSVQMALGFSVLWKVRAKGTGRMCSIKRSKREFQGDAIVTDVCWGPGFPSMLGSIPGRRASSAQARRRAAST